MITALCRPRVRILAPLASVPLLVMTPLGANAQVVATSFQELQALVKPGDTIHITEASGRKTTGRLGELSASSLELLVRKAGPDGRETFVPQARLSERDVAQIVLERRDSVLNGTLIGLAPGAAISVLFLLADGGCDCYKLEDRAGFAGGILVWAGGIGAAVGASIDALITERATVYYQPPGQRSSGVQISSFVSKSAAGIQASMRF